MDQQTFNPPDPDDGPGPIDSDEEDEWRHRLTWDKGGKYGLWGIARLADLPYNGWLFQIWWNPDGEPMGALTPKRYKLVCRLPGIKRNLGQYSVRAAQAKAESILAQWVARAGLTFKGDTD